MLTLMSLLPLLLLAATQLEPQANVVRVHPRSEVAIVAARHMLDANSMDAVEFESPSPHAFLVRATRYEADGSPTESFTQRFPGSRGHYVLSLRGWALNPGETVRLYTRRTSDTVDDAESIVAEALKPPSAAAACPAGFCNEGRVGCIDSCGIGCVFSYSCDRTRCKYDCICKDTLICTPGTPGDGKR